MYGCLICGSESEGSQKAHILPKSMGFYNTTPTSNNCNCDSCLGSQANVHLKHIYNYDTLCRDKKGLPFNKDIKKKMGKDIRATMSINEHNNLNSIYNGNKAGSNLIIHRSMNDPLLYEAYTNPLPATKGVLDFNINPFSVYCSLAHSLILMESYLGEYFLEKDDRDMILQKLKNLCNTEKIRDESHLDFSQLYCYYIGGRTGHSYISDRDKEYCEIVIDNSKILFFNIFLLNKMYTVEIFYHKNKERYKIFKSVIDIKKKHRRD